MIKPLEISIRELIASGGLIGPWADHRGIIQQAPTVQLYEFNEEDLRADERCMLIKNVGNGGGNFLVREPAMIIAVFSKEARGDMSAAKHYIELVKEHISRNFRQDCIMSVNIIGDVAGPYCLQSGRRYFDLNLNVITDTGEVL